MPRAKKTWREKLADSKGLPKVEPIRGRMSARWGRGTVALPSPLEVNGLMQQVPRGKVTTINELRSAIARKHNATIGCPLVTGIFCWIAANAAHEAESAGAKRITPYWRTLKAGGQLNPKFPGGIPELKRRLAAEGHAVVKRGGNYFVAEFEKHLFQPGTAGGARLEPGGG